MGDPKKIRKKYSTPAHPWQKIRIEEEIALKREYGLKNKKEIWIMDSMFKNFRNQVKRLYTMRGKQAEIEKEQIKNKLLSLGLLKPESSLDSVLGLEVKDIMERRLQTVLFRKSLARSMNQARQFIVHRHVVVAGKKITSPSYLVKVGEEAQISFVDSSALADPNHPERYEEMPSVKKKAKSKEETKPEKKEIETIAAFEEVHKTEEDIVKDIKPKEQKSEISELQNKEVSKKEEKEKKVVEKKKKEVAEEEQTEEKHTESESSDSQSKTETSEVQSETEQPQEKKENKKDEKDEKVKK